MYETQFKPDNTRHMYLSIYENVSRQQSGQSVSLLDRRTESYADRRFQTRERYGIWIKCNTSVGAALRADEWNLRQT